MVAQFVLAVSLVLAASLARPRRLTVGEVTVSTAGELKGALSGIATHVQLQPGLYTLIETLVPSADVHLSALGGGEVVLDGNSEIPNLLRVESGVNCTLVGLTLRGSQGDSAVINNGGLVLNQTVVRDSHGAHKGGGVVNNGAREPRRQAGRLSGPGVGARRSGARVSTRTRHPHHMHASLDASFGGLLSASGAGSQGHFLYTRLRMLSRSSLFVLRTS